MHIQQIPILSDNYSHLLIDEATNTAGVIDPAEPGPVLAAIAAAGVRLTHILCTHHHWDHAGGNLEMLQHHPDVTVVGSIDDASRIPGITTQVSDEDTVTIGSVTGRVLFVPCHTRGHIAYLFGDALFCGDTLFVAGCGRFFEGDGAQMHRALNGVFGQLPPETRVFCGHEYTVSNLRFALSVEPDNASAQAKMAWAQARRAAGESTVPSTIGEERTYNPFMRVTQPGIIDAIGGSNPSMVMSRLRKRKNEFRG